MCSHIHTQTCYKLYQRQYSSVFNDQFCAKEGPCFEVCVEAQDSPNLLKNGCEYCVKETKVCECDSTSASFWPLKWICPQSFSGIKISLSLWLSLSDPLEGKTASAEWSSSHKGTNTHIVSFLPLCLSVQRCLCVSTSVSVFPLQQHSRAEQETDLQCFTN